MLACPYKIAGVSGTKIEKSCDFIKRVVVCSKGGSLVNRFSYEEC